MTRSTTNCDLSINEVLIQLPDGKLSKEENERKRRGMGMIE